MVHDLRRQMEYEVQKGWNKCPSRHTHQLTDPLILVDYVPFLYRAFISTTESFKNILYLTWYISTIQGSWGA